MSEYIETPISVAVHLKTHNPVFGEQVTTVIVDDEAGGPFLVLKQSKDTGLQELRMDMEELEAVVIAARKLIAAHEALGIKQ